MKEKIFIFIVGLLIGAIITASGLLIYQKANKKDNHVKGEERVQMMNRHEGQEPPERPDGNQESRKELPTKQDGENNSNKQDTQSKNSKDTKTTNKE